MELLPDLEPSLPAMAIVQVLAAARHSCNMLLVIQAKHWGVGSLLLVQIRGLVCLHTTLP